MFEGIDQVWLPALLASPMHSCFQRAWLCAMPFTNAPKIPIHVYITPPLPMPWLG